MFTLIPIEQKKKLIVEYRVRLLIIGVFFVTVIFFLLTTLLLPSYLTVRSSFLSALQTQEEVTRVVVEKNKGDLSHVIEDLRKNLSVADIGTHEPTVLFEVISSEKGEKIKLQEFTYSAKELPSQFIIRIKGFAPDRKSLTLYQKNLLKHGEFTKVDLPIANLAKDTNINFDMVIVGNL
jgi:hypothetical protein